ncbi:MAG: glycosyltransferase family 39 protein [Acidobacteria bacterium]|nr:glycosyltransferase family 39 protein [Acidobacteriota bacterium]
MTTPPRAQTTDPPAAPSPQAPPSSNADRDDDSNDTRATDTNATAERDRSEFARRHADGSRDDDGDAPTPSLLGAWRWWLPVALAALALALLFVDPFAGDWDALDYTVLALRGEPSTMLFGRSLFIFTNHIAFRVAHALFGLSADDAYLLFKYTVVCEAPLAAVALWALARELTDDLRAATLAALMLAVSPFFVIYSGQAMTETPSLLLLSLSLVVHLRGVRQRRAALVLAGAALLGLDNNVREAAAIYGAWLVVAPFACGWKFSRRDLFSVAASCAVFFVCAFAPFLSFYLGDVNNYRAGWHGWVASMRAEEAVHPVGWLNFAPLLLFFFVAAPAALVALPGALRREWRARGFSPAFALACVGAAANLSLVTHYSAVINGRYLLTGLPGILPLTAAYLVRRATERTGDARRGFKRAATIATAAALVCGSVFYAVSRHTLGAHAVTKEYLARLQSLPPDAVVMAGGQTVSVNYYRALGYGHWDVIGTGGGFPGASRLADVIDGNLRAGRRVFVDTDSRLWFNDAWRGEETRALVALQTRFRFRRVSPTIYEIRPADDTSAQDDPQLARLLRQPPTPARRLLGWLKSHA